MTLIAEIEGVSVVLLGSFNPAIFHPDWFKNFNLISEEDHAFALEHLKVVHNTVSTFDVIEGVNLLVDIERFQLGGEYYLNPKIRDLILGTFNLLEHCPVKAMGINREIHFNTGSPKETEEILNKIIPVTRYSEIISEPRFQSVEIKASRPDKENGFVLTRIQPSIRIKNGIYVKINDHREAEGNNQLDLSCLMDKVKESWDDTMDYAKNIAEKILEA